MNKLVIGVDPDADKHGIALYRNGELTDLKMLNLMGFIDLIDEFSNFDITVSIEDNNAVSAAYKARDKKGGNGHIKLKMAQDIGKCKQAQIEIERACEKLGVKVVKYKQSKFWKSADTGKKQFERITGWTKRSNEDTRSAAYFGYLEAAK